ncbi:MAG: hypothetical protein ABDI07_00440 [Candidatus Kryptonium sp.]
MQTHVFIVNDDTFPIHLRYLFAGTGAGDEDNNISLLADIKRVRPGDFVIFYIEATTKVKGGFYGIFKIANQQPLVFHTPGQNGFSPNLNKKLIYRTLIEPYEVYSEGVPEWEALDKLPVYATEIQWSLIYRKLKGKRGCTPLLPWEAQRLIDMIRNKNSGKPIAGANFKGGLDWDPIERRIRLEPKSETYNDFRIFNYNVLSDICNLQRAKKSYEIHLQLYFTENIGFNPHLNPIVGHNLVWFGNEVFCGVGMQKIDILTICQGNEKREYRIIELKDEPIKPDIVDQIEYYVNWASQSSGKHLDGAYSWNIQPVIVAPSHKYNPPKWDKIVSAFKGYNDKGISKPILYFEFLVNCGKSISFNRVDYEN